MMLLWSAVLAAIVVVLLVTEQVALLYVLATLGIVAILVVVAMADLEGTRQSLDGRINDSAAISDGRVTLSGQPAPSKHRRV
ncbi:MAG: hypothetical protein ICV68_16555 [Pyrinomonadaceae bacterium]|nr:hypothetical protein [Pyrinomonadaceae bacterium]